MTPDPDPSRPSHPVLGVLRWVLLVGAIFVSLWNLDRLPSASPVPLALGVLPWVLGKYVVCALRWRSISHLREVSANWHLRRYAEGELLGMLTPAHAGSDLWRLRALTHEGVSRGAALRELGMDRLLGALGLALFVVSSGMMLPRGVLPVALGAGLVLLVAGVLMRDRIPRDLPDVRSSAKCVVLAVLYQLTLVSLMLGSVHAVGYSVNVLALLGVMGASQMASVVPGVHGATPREGALVAGLAALHLPWSAALGAVVLASLVAWVPALLLGGGSLLVGRLQARGAARVV